MSRATLLAKPLLHEADVIGRKVVTGALTPNAELRRQDSRASPTSLPHLNSTTNRHPCKIIMSFSDDRLCRNCTKLDLQAVFNPARFDGLPAIGSAQSYKTSWTKYIQHVGDWRPLTREERISQYPPGMIPSCPFCDLVFSIGFNLTRYPMAEKEKVMLAIPASLLYNFAAQDNRKSDKRLPDYSAVFLLVMNPSHYKTASAQYFGNTSAGGGLTAWIRFAHREAPGSLVSLASTAILEPSQPLLDLPMQARVLREERIDYGLIRSWIHLCERHHDACRTSSNWQTLPHFKLIDCETRLIINTDPSTRYRYVALSYVWGVAPPDKYTYPHLPDDLPPVIQDAMRATIKLGFRYIWIDRYCI